MQDLKDPVTNRLKLADDEERLSLAATADFQAANDDDAQRKWSPIRIGIFAAVGVALVAAVISIIGGQPEPKRIPAAGQIIDKDEFAQEWAWVQRHMGLSGLAVPPVIMAGNLLPVLGRSTTDGGHTVSGLSFGSVVILDEQGADLNSPHLRGRVVHEFVHQAQYAKRQPAGCGLERQAYDLQNAWLRERGAAPYATAAEINGFVSTCDAANTHQGNSQASSVP